MTAGESRYTPLALRELAALVGRETALDQIHGTVRRVAMSVRGAARSGTFLATCSDEFNGELRSSFERDVARVVTAAQAPGNRRVFAVSNLGGRVEPGALALAEQHFAARADGEGATLLLVEIAAHVGRREGPRGPIYGEIDRFGLASPCCGALDLLLGPPPSTAAVRHPWFDQLTAFFGHERLEALRRDPTPQRMVKAAIVHAVLQAESAITDLLRERPTGRAHFLLIPLVAINQRGPDTGLLVGYHHLRFDGEEMHIEQGFSLRTTPAALSITSEAGRLRVESPAEAGEEREAPTGSRADVLAHGQAAAVARPAAAAGHAPEVPRPRLEKARSPDVRAQIERTRSRIQHMNQRQIQHRAYARPLLRGLLQGLSILAPEVGVAALAVQAGQALRHMHRVHELLSHGPSTEDARRILRDIEAQIQQLGHRQAQEVLEILLAEADRLAEAR